MNIRLSAARIMLAVVEDGKSLATLLPAALEQFPAGEQAFGKELVYGGLRWFVRLSALVDELVSKPLRARDRDIRCLLVVGLYQLSRMDVARHAAVNETVQAARVAGKKWAAGLVNGVLRNYLRQQDMLERKLDTQADTLFSTPAWFLQRLQQDWPDHWQEIAAAGNRRAPMTLRVNLMRQSRDDWVAQAHDAGLETSANPFSAAAVSLGTPVAVDRLPGFRAGDVSVQDGAAQLAAELLDARPGMRVLDACAAPGGKTAHILERAGNRVQLTAVDADARRLDRVAGNLDRLHLKARLVCADASGPDAWWDGQPFDRILLDAPCSASGVVRRNPDIKMLRRTGDIDKLAKIQGKLLDRLWPLLSPDGILLYATCSIFRRENDVCIADFLARCGEASADEITAGWGRSVQYGRQILPGEQEMDGFFYARLARSPG